MRLIGALQAGGGQNCNELARECGVSRRTIFRDLGVLRAAGVPVFFDDVANRYSIPHTYFLPPTNFTPEEALTVMVLCRGLGREHALPLCEAADRAATKLECALPAPLARYVRETAPAVQLRPERTNPLDGRRSTYELLLRAIVGRHAVRIDYDSPSEDRRLSTKLCPYQLLFSRRSWYVVGRSSVHREVRTFNIGRIVRIDVTAESFERPPRFSIDRYLGNAWHLIREPGPDREVRIVFDKLVARNVAEVAWHKTQRTQFLPDGRLDFRVTVAGLGEISWWILGYGDQAEVIEPPELRQLVATRARRLLSRYRKKVSGTVS